MYTSPTSSASFVAVRTLYKNNQVKSIRADIMTGFSIDDILDKKVNFMDDSGDEPPSFKFLPGNYLFNLFLLFRLAFLL